MVSLGVVQEDATIYFMLSTSAADGGRENPSATMEEADFVIVKDGSAMTLDASTITITDPFNSDVGVHLIAIDLSNDADFTTGSEYWVYLHPDETVDSQSVAGIIGHFRIENDSEQAARQLREYVYPNATISTTTSNSTTAINLTDIVDAQTDNDSLIGQLLLIRDASDGALIWATVTDLTSLVATVELFPDGGAMPITVAASDLVWIMGPVVAHRLGTGEDGTNLTEAGGDGDHLTEAGGDGDHLTEAGATGDHLTAVPWNSAWDAEVQSEVTDAMNAFTSEVDFAGIDVSVLNTAASAIGSDGTGLTEAGGTGDHLTALATAAALTTVDTVVDAIKIVTDLLSPSANAVISGAAATGTLNTTTATSNLTGYADDQLIGRILYVLDGDAAGEATDITDYANTNGTLTFTALTTAMADGDNFVIL